MSLHEYLALFRQAIEKVEDSYLTGVEKILMGWNLTAELVENWVETKNCGPAP